MPGTLSKPGTSVLAASPLAVDLRPDKSRASRYSRGRPGGPHPEGKGEDSDGPSKAKVSRPQKPAAARRLLPRPLGWRSLPCPCCWAQPRCTWGSLGCGCTAGALPTWGHPRGAPCRGLTHGEPGSLQGVSPRLPATRPSRVHRGGRAAVAPAFCRVAGTAPRDTGRQCLWPVPPRQGSPQGAALRSGC